MNVIQYSLKDALCKLIAASMYEGLYSWDVCDSSFIQYLYRANVCISIEGIGFSSPDNCYMILPLGIVGCILYNTWGTLI